MSPRRLLTSVRTLNAVLGPFRRRAVVLFVLILLAALAESLGLGMVLPLLQLMVGDGAPGAARYLGPLLRGVDPRNHLLVVALLLLGLVAAKSGLTVLREYATFRFVNGLRLHWSRAVLERTVQARFTKLLRRKKGALLNDIVNEPAYASTAVRDITEFAARAVLGALTLSILLLVDWRMTGLVAALFGAVVVVVWRVSRRYSVNVGKKRVALSQQLSAAVTDALAGIRQIKLFAMEKAVVEDCVSRLGRVVRMLEKFRVVSRLPATLSELLIAGFLVGFLIVARYGLGMELGGILPVLAVFVIGAQRLVGVASELLSMRMAILSYLPSLRLVHGMVSEGYPPESEGGGREIRELREGVRFGGVSFSYDVGRPLFVGIDLILPVGALTVMVGPSGAGKSTICDLLIRLVRPQAGRILVDGRELEELDLASWRGLVGYVSQDSFLFNTTVKENVRVGRPQATDQEIVQAARLADADEFIDGLPDGYDTLVGDGGVGLSGGQRQRIALARALVRDPRVLILDEATAALDADSERRIFEAVARLKRDRVVLLISHRPSALAIADAVYRVARRGEAVTVERSEGGAVIESR